MSHEDYLRKAIDLSFKMMRERKGGPFGCVIVKDNEIIAEGVNQVTSLNDPTAHGEIVAIRNACKHLDSFNLEGCIMYTSSEPCAMCLGAIYWSHIDKVYYGNSVDDAADIGFEEDVLIYREMMKEIDVRSIEFTQILHDESIKAFEEWDKMPDKIEY